MIYTRAPAALRRPPTWASREVLLEFVRAIAPDLRIRKARLENGKRACGASFTIRGEVIEVEAIEADDLPDPDDAIVRRCAWLIYRRLGIQTHLDDEMRQDLTRKIIAAAQAGDTQLADKLGLELALFNEGRSGTMPLRIGAFER